jgi:hypothetical protein
MTKPPSTTERLSDEAERQRFFETVLDTCDVTKACEKLRLHKSTVYAWFSKHPELDRQFRSVRGVMAEMQWDECNRIVDEATAEIRKARDKKDRQALIAAVRLQVETRMRTAGKRVAHLADRPLAEVNVNATAVTVTDEVRQRLIDLRNEALADGPSE